MHCPGMCAVSIGEMRSEFNRNLQSKDFLLNSRSGCAVCEPLILIKTWSEAALAVKTNTKFNRKSLLPRFLLNLAFAASVSWVKMSKKFNTKCDFP